MLYFVTTYTVFSILSYLTVILAILLFKIGAAIVPGEWKHKPKARLLLLLEVMIHILIPVLSLSVSAVVTFHLNRTDHNCIPPIKYSVHSLIDVIFYVILVLSVLYCIPATVLL